MNTLKDIGRVLWIGLRVVGVGILFIAALYFWDVRAARSVPVTTTESIPPTEQAEILELIRMATDIVMVNDTAGGLVRRDAHAKPHGCVKAQFTVREQLSAELSHGVFKESGRSFEAWIRFSNGTQHDDTENDARGMAIKLLGVEGEKVLTPLEDPEQNTQDFVMVNYHTFFLAELEDYKTFFNFQAANKPISYFFQPSYNPFQWKLRELGIGLPMLGQKVSSPLKTQYYSMSAYRLGLGNMKFSARPCEEADAKRRFWPLRWSGDKSENFLREALVSELDPAGTSVSAACFDFMVQLQDPTKHMPIEDPTIVWKESGSTEYQPVARVTIEPQTFDTDEQNDFCERLQFAPYHSLPEQKPVGRMNRVRHFVYRAVSKRRHDANGVDLAIPRASVEAGAPSPGNEGER